MTTTVIESLFWFICFSLYAVVHFSIIFGDLFCELYIIFGDLFVHFSIVFGDLTCLFGVMCSHFSETADDHSG